MHVTSALHADCIFCAAGPRNHVRSCSRLSRCRMMWASWFPSRFFFVSLSAVFSVERRLAIARCSQRQTLGAYVLVATPFRFWIFFPYAMVRGRCVHLCLVHDGSCATPDPLARVSALFFTRCLFVQMLRLDALRQRRYSFHVVAGSRCLQSLTVSQLLCTPFN